MTVAAEPVQLLRNLPRGEQRRNSLLRRVDWRFLLPTAHFGTSVCCTDDDTLAEAVGALSDRVVELEHARNSEIDLAVLVDPDSATLRAVYDALAPGGACYAEWTSYRTGRVSQVNQKVRAAGFVDVAPYWAWPPPASAPRCWIPLERPAARGYFLSSRRLRPGVLGALRQLGLRTAWRVAARVNAIGPVCVVARKPGGHSEEFLYAGMNLDIERRLRDGWVGWELGPRPSSLSWVLQTGGESSFNKIVGFVCAEPDPDARIVVKISRGATADVGLQREARALNRLAAERPDMRSVPRLLFCGSHGSGLVLAQSVAPGRALEERLRRNNLRRYALAVTDWFARLAGRPAPSPQHEWLPRLVEPLLTGFEAVSGPGVRPRLVTPTRALLCRIGELPLVTTHGDAGPVNVLVDDKDQLSVIDWEDCETRGLPVADLVLLLTFMFFHLEDPWRTGRYCEVYRQTLDPRTEYGRLRAECLARYGDQVGINPAAIGPLCLLPWMRRSLREHQGMQDATLGPEGREAFRRGLYLSLWEEELNHWSAR